MPAVRTRLAPLPCLSMKFTSQIFPMTFLSNIYKLHFLLLPRLLAIRKDRDYSRPDFLDFDRQTFKDLHEFFTIRIPSPQILSPQITSAIWKAWAARYQTWTDPHRLPAGHRPKYQSAISVFAAHFASHWLQPALKSAGVQQPKAIRSGQD